MGAFKKFLGLLLFIGGIASIIGVKCSEYSNGSTGVCTGKIIFEPNLSNPITLLIPLILIIIGLYLMLKQDDYQ